MIIQLYLEEIKTAEQLWDNFKTILEQNNRARLQEPLTVTEFNQVKKIISNIDTPYPIIQHIQELFICLSLQNILL